MAYIGNTPSAVIQNVTSAGITDGTIQNVDIAADAAIAATKIAGLSTVATSGAYADIIGTPTVLNYVNGVTSAIQTQLDAKGTVSSLANLSISATAAELNTLDGVPATLTATELGYVDGVTSAIQTQLNAKVGATYTGDVDITGELLVDSYNETYAALSGATPAVNCEAGNAFSLVLSAATTFTFTNPPSSGTAYTFSLELKQDSAGSGHAVTWPSSIDWPGGSAPTLTGTANAVDCFVFTTRDGGTTWLGFTAGQAIA